MCMKKYASHIGGHAGLLKALPQNPEAIHVCSKVCRNRIPVGSFSTSFVMRLVWDIDFARWLAFVYKWLECVY